MATNAGITLKLDGSASLTGPAGLLQRAVTLPLGSGSWGDMKLALTFGTGNNQVNNWWADERTVAAGANDDLDLSGTLSNVFSELLSLTAVKLLLLLIKDADGVKRLRVGPQGLAQAFQGPWGGVTATDYTEVKNFCPLINAPWAGYAVGAGATDKLRINNPSAVPVTYKILIAGVQ